MRSAQFSASHRAPRSHPATRGAPASGRAIGVLLCALLALAIARDTAAAQALVPTRVIDLNALRGNPHPNALGLGDVAIDRTRNLAYAYAARTGTVAVFDVLAGREVRLLRTEELALGDSVALDVNPTALMLLVRSTRRPGELLGISVIAGTVVARYETPGGGPITGVAVDAAGNRVYVADGTPVIRILDGMSLRSHDSIAVSGSAPAGAIAFDSTRSQLVSVSAVRIKGRVALQCYDGARPHALARNLSVRSDEEVRLLAVSGRDRRMLLGGVTTAHVVSSEGLLVATITVTGGISGAVMDEARNQAIVLDAAGDSTDGLHRLSGKLHLIDLPTGRSDSLLVGHRVRGLAMHQSSGRLLLTSEGENRLLVLGGPLRAIEHAIDPGESADALAWDAERAELYVADAHGDGNGIAQVAGPGPAAEMLRGGVWPVGIAFDPSLHRLFSIDHCESAVSVFDVADSMRRVSLRIPGIREARSHDLSHLSLDPVSHLVLACVPEHETWVLVDGAAARILRSGPVDGYSYSPGGGAGRLQGAVDGASGVFVILRVADRLLNVHRIADGSLLTTVELASPLWDRIGKADAELLYVDAARSRLFVGPLLVDMSTWTLLPQTLPAAAFVAGTTLGGALLLGVAVDDSVRLTVHRAADLRLEGSFALAPYGGGTPVVHADPRGERFFFADADRAIVREYSLSMLVGVAEAPRLPSGDLLRLFPNPVAAGTSFAAEFAPGFPDDASPAQAVFQLCDVAGRVHRAIRVDREGVRTCRCVFDTSALPAGVYVLRVACGSRTACARVLVSP